jgi:hypothetical protein
MANPTHPILSYRVHPNGALWHWEVLDGSNSLAQGDEKTSHAARIEAMLFALRSRTGQSTSTSSTSL